MGDNGTIWLPEGASTFSGEIDGLFYFVYWVSVVLFIGVVGTMLYFVYKYRRRSPGDRPEPVHENKLMELTWIVVPTILVLVVFTWGFQAFLRLGVAPPNAYQIQVQAQKWAWQFTYPNGAKSGNELHVPVGRPVRLQMNSVDVIHSFFIPAFRVKQDVVPNRYTALWFEATKQDTFQVFCTEYCGTNHSGMLAKVIVHSEDDFQRWLQESQVDENASPAERGEILYSQQGCQGCHSLDGSRGVGPSFQGLYGSTETLASGETVQVDETYLHESIVNPAAKVVQGFQPVMPAAYGGLSADELTALIEFIKTQQ